MRTTTLDKQYQQYLDTYYKNLDKYNMDFLRPLTKGEYKNARESYIADKKAEGQKVYPSNINRDLVNAAKDYAMTPEQARAYKRGLEEMGIKVKYKTLRTNKAIKEKLDDELKEYYREQKEKYQKEGKEIPTKKIAQDIAEYYFGS